MSNSHINVDSNSENNVSSVVRTEIISGSRSPSPTHEDFSREVVSLTNDSDLEGVYGNSLHERVSR